MTRRSKHTSAVTNIDYLHLSWIRRQPCCVFGCVGQPVEAHHVRTAANSGTGMKPDAAWTIPLCHAHHNAYHIMGRHTFERVHSIDLDDQVRFYAAASGTEMP